MRNTRGTLLTNPDLRRIEREYRLYLQQHRHTPGRKAQRETFFLATVHKRFDGGYADLITQLKKLRPELKFKPARRYDTEPPPYVPKASRLVRSVSFKKIEWEKNWRDARTATAIMRLARKKGELPTREIMRGSRTKEQQERIARLALSMNAALELHVIRKRKDSKKPIKKFLRALPEDSPELVKKLAEIDREVGDEV